jgi:hypothetical protein
LAVHNNLTSITVSATGNATTVVYGTPLQLSATGNYEVGTSKISGATWTSSASTQASVSTTGLVTAQLNSRGKVVMISCAFGGLNPVSYQLTVSALVQTVMVSGASTVSAGLTTNFTATATYNDTSSGDITQTATWTSSSTTIATVSAPGVILGTYGGATVIMATMNNGSGTNISGQANLTVNPVLLQVDIAVGSGGSNQLQQTGSETFTATAIYDGAPNADVSASATWASQTPNIVTIAQGTSPVTVTGVGAGTTNLSATFNSKTATYGLTVIPGLLSIVVTPAGPGLGVGFTQQFKATGFYTGGSSQDITSTAAWGSSNNGLATINTAGLATGVAPGGVTVNATAVGPNNQNIMGTTAVDVVNGAPINLSGNYTFTLTSGDTRGPAYYAGQFDITTAGTTGVFTGVEDCNTLATGVVNAVALSGSFTTWPDGRGILTFANNTCHPTGVTFRFALAASNGVQWQKGRLAQFDGFGTTEGTIEAQNSADFSTAALNHAYAFKLAGIDSASQPLGFVGTLPLDGFGNIGSGGLYDYNDFGTIVAQQTISPAATAYTVDATTGRGTLALTTMLGAGNYVFYIVDQNTINLIETDTLPSVLGRAETQTPGLTYDSTYLAGGYAFSVGRPVVVGTSGGTDKTEFGSVGQYSFTSGSSCTSGVLPSGSGITGTRDDAGVPSGGSGTNPFSISGCYVVASTGRFIFTSISPNEGPSPGLSHQFVAYPISTTSGKIDSFFMLQTYDGSSLSSGSLNAATGEGSAQAASFSLAALNGNYSISASEITSSYSEGLLQLTFDGTGFTNGLIDYSNCATGCSVSSTLVTNAAVTLPPGSVGRGAIILPPALGFSNFVFYLIDSNSAYILGTNATQAGSLGVLAIQ